MDSKTLRELYDALGVTRRAIQVYEKAGLVSATSKNKYGHLLYDKAAQDRIKLIKLYQQLGFQIAEIKYLIDAPGHIVKAALEQRILVLRAKQIEIDDLIQKAYKLIQNL